MSRVRRHARRSSDRSVGMMFVASGYGAFPNDLRGNVLLAFKPAR
jgi:hypothetical protein